MTQSKGVLGNLVSAPRAQILQALSSGEKSVGDLVRETALSQPNLSNHLSRLRQQGLVQPRRDGRKIFYTLADRRLQEWLGHEQQVETIPPSAEVYAAYLDALCGWNISEAERILMRAAEKGLSWKTMYQDILLPALRQVGDGWEAGQVSVAQEHAASELTERMMSRLYPHESFSAESLSSMPQAVVGCITGEQHAIGARMAADFLEDAGWRVLFLGANVPLDDYLFTIDRHQPRLALLSVTLRELEGVALKTVATLRARFAESVLHILIGGQPAERRLDCFRSAGADAVPNDPQHSVACAAAWLAG